MYVEEEKKTHEAVTPVENMDFARATIGKKKKGTYKPKVTDLNDPPPSYMRKQIQLLSFKAFFQNVQQVQWVCMLRLIEPQLEEAVEDQENLNVHYDTETPQHDPYTIENLSPSPERATLQQIKDARVALKRKASFSDDEIVNVEKKNRFRSKCAFLSQNAKELHSLKPTTSPA